MKDISGQLRRRLAALERQRDDSPVPFPWDTLCGIYSRDHLTAEHREMLERRSQPKTTAMVKLLELEAAAERHQQHLTKRTDR